MAPIIAHGPPAVVFLAALLFFLALGAVLPPYLYLYPHPTESRLKRITCVLIGGVLNIYGFLTCLGAAWFICQIEFYESEALTIGTMLGTMSAFALAEYLSFQWQRRRLARKTARTALDYFHEGYSCAQSVVAPFAAELGLTEEQALRLSSGFGAGIGRMRETCGAFCGLTFVAGHCCGNLQGDAAQKERIFSLVRQEAEQFRAEFGTLQCRELLHLNADAQEGARPNERTAAYYAARPCERCVAFCEARASELLNTHPHKSSIKTDFSLFFQKNS